MGGGCLITEFLPDYVPKAKNSFFLRNRVIAGLSDAVAVIEAPEKSGTLITAHLALEQGKEVYALVEGGAPIQHAGCRSLLQDGAKPLTTPKELLSDFPNYKVDFKRLDSISSKQMKNLYEEFLDKQRALEEAVAKKKTERKTAKSPRNQVPPKVAAPKKSVATPTGLDPKTKTVFEAFGDSEVFADEIVLKTKLDTATVLTALTMLEVKGLIEALPGSRYRLKID